MSNIPGGAKKRPELCVTIMAHIHYKKATEVTTSPLRPPYTRKQLLLVGSGDQRNQLCQISARSVQGFLSPRLSLIHI